MGNLTSTAPLAAPPVPHPRRRGLPRPPPPDDKRLAKPGFSRSGALLGGVTAVGFTLAGLATTTPVLWWPAAGCASVFVLWVVRELRGLRRFNQRLIGAASSLQGGQLGQARRDLEKLLDEVDGRPARHASLVLQMANAACLEPDVERALSLLCVVERSAWLKRSRPVIAEQLPFQLARMYALRGSLDDARAWFDAGKKRLRIQPPYVADLCEALLLTRGGQCSDASELLQKHWTFLERASSGDAMKAHRVLLAFCLHQLGREPERVRDLLAAAQPFGDEVRALALPWGELLAFVREQLPDEALPPAQQ